jgi:coiled-coil domain-containing protein 12
MGDDRRARLRALAAKAGRSISSADDADAKDETTQLEQEVEIEPAAKPQIKFRNYAPKSQEFEMEQVEQSEVGDGDGAEVGVSRKRPRKEAPKESGDGKTDEEEDGEPLTLDAALEKASAAKAPGLAEENYSALRGETSGPGAGGEAQSLLLAPRKVNWDLKKQIQPKLDRLERRTQRAIVDLLRERLEREAKVRVEEENDNNEEDVDLD